jgi:ubiquinone/menaquinone biosynthesis C-methylase UbiE
MTWQEDWLQRFYQSQPGWKDGTTLFHEICHAHARLGGEILEVGAGPTNATSAFLSSLGNLHGIDVSEEVHGNVHLKSSALIEGSRYPYADGAFDLVVSNYVVEHVEDPSAHLTEIFRVLKPGGAYVFRTPNLMHYVALVSRFTAHRFHRLTANRLRGYKADKHDPWPTVYAMNTPASLRRHARSAGFEVVRLDLVEKEPSYGMVARPLFLAFMAYERVVNASELLGPLRANMFVVLRRPTR